MYTKDISSRYRDWLTWVNYRGKIAWDQDWNAVFTNWGTQRREMNWRLLQGYSWHLLHSDGGGGGSRHMERRELLAMLNEYKQLHNLDYFGPQNPKIMHQQEKYRALRAVNLIKEKRWGKIKGMTWADGSCQCTYIPKEEATVPTIILEALFASLLIDAHKGRALHTFDIPGSYLHASTPDYKVVYMKYEGEFWDILFKVNPEYLNSWHMIRAKRYCMFWY